MVRLSTIVDAALRVHQPEIDWPYEEFNCSCGWKESNALGLHTIKDGSRDWPSHQRKAVRAALIAATSEGD